MVTSAFVMSLVLAGQLSGDGRYNGVNSGQSGSTLITPIGDPADAQSDLGSAPPRPPFDAAPPAAPGSTSTPAASSAKNAFRDSPSGTSASSSPAAKSQAMQQFGGEPRPFGSAATTDTQSKPAAYEVTPGGQSNFGPPAPLDAGLKPSALMRAMLLNRPAGSQLTGTTISLREAIAGAPSRADQTQRVEAYWDLCSSVSDYYLGILELEEFGRLKQMSRGAGPEWDQAEKVLRVRIGTSQRAALTSQLRLASMIGRGGSLPLPADTPHCASYTTHFDKIFAGGGSPEAKELAALLPLRYEELRDASAAVTQAEKFSQQVASGGDAIGTLKALEFLALRRRAFVQIARDYNRRIARYSELATPGQVTPDRLTSMLILTPSSTATRPGALPGYNQRSATGAKPPSTYIEGSESAMTASTGAARRDDAVQQTSGTQPATSKKPAARVERSLLVSPHE